MWCICWHEDCNVCVDMAELLDNLYNQENYLISKKLLDATHLRHEALSNNLANVETPWLQAQGFAQNFCR